MTFIEKSVHERGRGRNMQSTCAACLVSSVKVHIEIHDGIEMLLCNDFRACNRKSGVIKV